MEVSSAASRREPQAWRETDRDDDSSHDRREFAELVFERLHLGDSADTVLSLKLISQRHGARSRHSPNRLTCRYRSCGGTTSVRSSFQSVTQIGSTHPKSPAASEANKVVPNTRRVYLDGRCMPANDAFIVSESLGTPAWSCVAMVWRRL